MDFKNIPKFTESASYRINQPWNQLIIMFDKWVDDYGLQLEPDFQRAHVWTTVQQQNYVEYILRDGRSGRDIYMNHPGWMGSFKGDFVLVDGLQRLTAVRNFLENKIEAFGCYYKDYEGELGYDTDFVIHVNDLNERDEVLQWYIDLNTGGTQHTEAEIFKVKQLLAAERK